MQVPDNSHLPTSPPINNGVGQTPSSTAPLNSYLGRVVTNLSLSEIEDNGGSSVITASALKKAMVYSCCGRSEDFEAIQAFERTLPPGTQTCIFCKKPVYQLIPNRSLQDVVDSAIAKEKALAKKDNKEASKDPVDSIINQISVKMVENPIAALEFCYNCWENYEDNPKLIDIKDSILQTLSSRYKTEKDTLFVFLLEFEDKICVKALETYRHDLTKLFDNEHKSEAEHISRRQPPAQQSQRPSSFVVRLGREEIPKDVQTIFECYYNNPSSTSSMVATSRAVNVINELLRTSSEKINASPIGRSLTQILEVSLNYCYTPTNTVPIGFIGTIATLITQALAANANSQTNALRIGQNTWRQMQPQAQHPLNQGPQRLPQPIRGYPSGVSPAPSRAQQSNTRPSTQSNSSNQQYPGMPVPQIPRPQQYSGMPVPRSPRPQQYPGNPSAQPPRPQQYPGMPSPQPPRPQQYPAGTLAARILGPRQNPARTLAAQTPRPQQYLGSNQQYPEMPQLQRQQGAGRAQALPPEPRAMPTPTPRGPLPSSLMHYQNPQPATNPQAAASSIQNIPFLASVSDHENRDSSLQSTTEGRRLTHSPLIMAMLQPDNLEASPSNRETSREDLYAGEEPEEKENDINPDSFLTDFVNSNEEQAVSSSSTSSTPSTSQSSNRKLILQMYEELANLADTVDRLATETISGGERKRKHGDSNQDKEEVIDLASADEKETPTSSSEKEGESLVPKRRRLDQSEASPTTIFLDDEQEEEVESGNVSTMDSRAAYEAPPAIPGTGVFFAPPQPLNSISYAMPPRLAGGYDVELILRAIDHVNFKEYKQAIAHIPREHLVRVFTSKINLTYDNQTLLEYIFRQPASQKKHADIKKIALHMLSMGAPLTEEILLKKPNKIYWKNPLFLEKAKAAGLLKYNPYNQKK